jgi:hypothetical protein
MASPTPVSIDQRAIVAAVHGDAVHPLLAIGIVVERGIARSAPAFVGLVGAIAVDLHVQDAHTFGPLLRRRMKIAQHDAGSQCSIGHAHERAAEIDR